jgi:uncharacterized membrane protein YczE
MNNNWYRYLNIIAAIFIGIGGIGINTFTQKSPEYYTCLICLVTGVIIFGIFMFMKLRERPADNSNQ